VLIKTDDGLAHVQFRPEDEDHWGKTVCEILFTIDPDIIEAFSHNGGTIDEVCFVVTTPPPTTCFACLARSAEP